MNLSSYFFRMINNRGASEPFLLRWFIIPRNKWLNIYLHKFIRSDDTTFGLHDHPWWFISIILWQGYFELREYELDDGSMPYMAGRRYAIRRNSGTIVFRHAMTRHAVQLIDDKPSWSIIITGRYKRKWGFYTEEGWRAFDEVGEMEDAK